MIIPLISNMGSNINYLKKYTMKKVWYKSKRFWGLVIVIIGKALPIIAPSTAPFVPYLPELGGIIFGVGCLDASKPVGL